MEFKFKRVVFFIFSIFLTSSLVASVALQGLRRLTTGGRRAISDIVPEQPALSELGDSFIFNAKMPEVKVENPYHQWLKKNNQKKYEELTKDVASESTSLVPYVEKSTALVGLPKKNYLTPEELAQFKEVQKGNNHLFKLIEEGQVANNAAKERADVLLGRSGDYFGDNGISNELAGAGLVGAGLSGAAILNKLKDIDEVRMAEDAQQQRMAEEARIADEQIMANDAIYGESRDLGLIASQLRDEAEVLQSAYEEARNSGKASIAELRSLRDGAEAAMRKALLAEETMQISILEAERENISSGYNSLDLDLIRAIEGRKHELENELSALDSNPRLQALANLLSDARYYTGHSRLGRFGSGVYDYGRDVYGSLSDGLRSAYNTTASELGRLRDAASDRWKAILNRFKKTPVVALQEVTPEEVIAEQAPVVTDQDIVVDQPSAEQAPTNQSIVAELSNGDWLGLTEEQWNALSEKDRTELSNLRKQK